MSDQRWSQFKDVLHAALQLAPDERGRYLEEACGPDLALRREVESMLIADARIGPSLLRSSFGEDSGLQNSGVAGMTLAVGEVFAGRYVLVRKLGEGGMGQVWLAEQTEPLRRPVALKLIRAGMYDEAVVRRFQSERQSVAIMDHPAIAKVFDAGATPQGQPYFVMEYVPGVSITEYCDQHELTIRERLELFIQVCEGVQHAHQKAIIHRDLKPANILIVEVNGHPQPRIIDFGLAKGTTPALTEETLHTRFGQFLGTPGYMSPEQVDPNIKDIDTRTDVYSLGVILYVLLTGLQPFETQRGQRPPLDVWLRQLREEEPPSPSNKVNTERENSRATAEARGSEPQQLVRLLRGDLDWITLKALERDRERRYGTASELAADLLRYLDHEPVLARPAGVAYRLLKYARRHRLGVGIAAAVLGALTVFSLVQAVQLRRITAERDRATHEQERASRVTDFMVGIFKVSNPSESRGNTITAREILDKAATQIQTGLQHDPALQAQLMYTMGTVYSELALDSKALDLLQHAVAIQVETLGARNRATLQSMSSVGRTLRYLGRYAEAEKMNRETLAVQTQVLGAEDPDTLDSMVNLANTLNDEGDLAAAERLERAALDARRRVQGPENPATLETVRALSVTLRIEGKYTEAEALQRELVSIQRRVLGADHPSTLKSLNSLGATLYSSGKLEEAEAAYREVLRVLRRVNGPEHDDTLTASINVASILRDQGHYEEAEEMLREVLRIRRRDEGDDNPGTLLTMETLALVLSDEGRYEEAEALERATIEGRRRVLGKDHPDTLRTTRVLALTLVAERRFQEAERIGQEALDGERRVLGTDSRETFEAMAAVGSALRGEGRFEAAERSLRGALDTAKRRLPADHPEILEIQSELALDLSHEKRYPEARPLFLDAARSADRTMQRELAASNWYNFARGAAVAGQVDESIENLRTALSRGYRDSAGIRTEPDFAAVRADPAFQRVIADLKAAPSR